MAFNLSLVKKHPIASTSIILIGGVGAWYFIFGGQGGGNSSSPSGSMVVYGNQGSAPVDNTGAQISAQLSALGIQSQTSLALAQLKNQGDATMAAYQYQIAQLEAGVQVSHDQNAADIAKYQTSAQLQALTTQYSSLVQQSNISANAQIQAASINADVAKYTGNLNAQLQQSIAKYQADIAGYNAFSNTQIATANANAYSSAARAQASAQKTQTYAGLVMGLANLFCDVNIKHTIKCVDINACLLAVDKLPLNIFSYKNDSAPSLAGDIKQHVQTYAQDFYRLLGCEDYASRETIDSMDMMGVLFGAIKAMRRGGV